MIKNYSELIEKAKSQKGNKTVAVAMANEKSVLKAVANSVKEGIVNAVLVGNKTEMEKIAKEQNFSLEGMEIINTEDEKEAASICVNLILEGKAHFLMKGFIKTSTLLKAVFKEKSLKESDVISHVAVLDIPNRDRLFLFSDGGIIEKPNKSQKKAIGENLIKVAFALGINNPKIGFLSTYSNYVSEENSKLAKELEKEFGGVKVFPAVETKEAFKDYDGVIANRIEECNIITKSLTLFSDTVFAGIIAGTKVPVCLVSRADSEKNKAASLALGAIFANRGN